jgi:uncharacterized protein (DUF983 family)
MISESLPPLRTVLARGLRKKCPNCAKGALFHGWNRLNERCPVCNFKYLENEGDLWGYLLIVDRALFLLPIIVLLYFRLSNPNSAWFYIISGLLIFLLIYTLPHRNGMNLALDYYFRRKWGDLSNQTPS